MARRLSIGTLTARDGGAVGHEDWPHLLRVGDLQPEDAPNRLTKI